MAKLSARGNGKELWRAEKKVFLDKDMEYSQKIVYVYFESGKLLKRRIGGGYRVIKLKEELKNPFSNTSILEENFKSNGYTIIRKK